MNNRLLLPSLILLTVAHAAAAAPTNGPHSAAHPLKTPPTQVAATVEAGNVMSVLPTSLAWEDGRRAFYTSAVNAVSARARAGSQEWLATEMGVKEVDFASRQVRHYTRLDGLPGNRILDVAATGPNTVYCISQSTQADRTTWNVCRFEAANRRWAVERGLVRPDDQAYRQAIPAGLTLASFGYLPPPDQARAFLAVSHGGVYFAPDVSLNAADPLLLLRSPSSGVWRTATPGTALRAGVGPLRVLSLHMADDGSPWLGTNRGLWRYVPARDAWMRFLPNESILLAAVQGGGVWVVAPGTPVAPVAAGVHDQTLPRLILLDAATGATRSWPFPPRTFPFDSWATRPATLAVGIDGRVWTCEGDSTFGLGSRFCVFDPQAQQWQIVPANGARDLAAVPDGALPLPLPTIIAPAREYARRFPEWFCPDEPRPAVPWHFGAGQTFWMDREVGPRSEADRYQPLLSERDSHYPTQFGDPGGVTWSLAHNAGGDYAVIRTGPAPNAGTGPGNGNRGRDVYPWPGADIATNPAIYTVGYIGGVLLVTTEHKDWAVNPAHETWAMTDLWRTRPGGSPRRILPQGDHAWAGDGQALVRYNPKTGQAQPRFQSQDNRRLLAVTGAGRLWLVEESHNRLPWKRLYRVEPGSNTPVEVPLTLPLALRPTPRESRGYVNDTLEVTPLPTTPDPIAVSETPGGELVWCVGWMTLRSQQVVCLIGYDPAARRWTTPQSAGWSEGDLHPITVGHKVYVPVPGGAAAVWEYDTLTGKWAVAAPAFRGVPGFAADALTLISVFPDALWCLDANILRVCRCDRRTGAWSVSPCPVQYGGNAGTDKVARVGSALFIASREGLWRSDMRGQTWRRLPVPDHEREIEFMAGDAKRLWGKTQQGVARFDKATCRWTTFNRADDSPERFVSNDLAADGSGAWLYGNSPAYRLDLATGRWEDMTRGALADPLLTLLVQEVVPDRRWVWLLPGDVRAQRNIGTEASAPLLGRYEVLTGRMDWLGGPGHPAVGGLPAAQDSAVRNRAAMMLVESDLVWVGTQDGVYRYDKAAQSLSRFGVPPSYPIPPDFRPNSVVRAGDALWLIGNNGQLRWVP